MSRFFHLLQLALFPLALPVFASSETLEIPVSQHHLNRPNFVVIIADDMRRDQLGYTGHPIIETPNIDELSRSSTIFHSAFATSPICTPSRTSLLTGRLERSHGVNFMSGNALSAIDMSLSYPLQMRSAGYYTGYVGKNHTPVSSDGQLLDDGYSSGLFEESFDFWFGNHGHIGFYPKNRFPIYRNAENDTQVEILLEGVKTFFSNTVKINNNQNLSKRPFTLIVNLNLPHAGGTLSMERRLTDGYFYNDYYRDKLLEFSVPDNYVAESEIIEPKIPENVYNGNYISQYDYVKNIESLREQSIRIAQTTSGIDRMVGKIVELLTLNSQISNTVIVFTSDNGIMLGEHGLGGKTLLYEPSVRVPLIISVPETFGGINTPETTAIVGLIDIAPTLLDYADIQIPESMQGMSLRPLIDNEINSLRENILLENLFTGQNYPRVESVRGERYKYIRYFSKDLETTYDQSRFSTLNGELPIYEEFFDLVNDSSELNNLIDDPELQDIISFYRRENERLLSVALGSAED